jgi:hypothetical protein
MGISVTINIEANDQVDPTDLLQRFISHLWLLQISNEGIYETNQTLKEISDFYSKTREASFTPLSNMPTKVQGKYGKTYVRPAFTPINDEA